MNDDVRRQLLESLEVVAEGLLDEVALLDPVVRTYRSSSSLVVRETNAVICVSCSMAPPKQSTVSER